MKRKLRPTVEKILICITMILFIIGISIDSFELRFIPIYLLIWAVVCFNGYIIHRYGNGLIYEEEDDVSL